MLHVTNETLNISQADVGFFLALGASAAENPGSKLGREYLTLYRRRCAEVRKAHGFKAIHAPILSHPEGQHKLGLGTVPSYGITLYHYVFKSAYMGRTWNMCPSAGDCTKMCVLNNGNGMYDNVQRGWRWRTDLLLNYPQAFFVLLGYEIQRAIIKHETPGRNDHAPRILVRPNVNSDIEWHKVAPALVDGSVFADKVKFYGYTKHVDVLYPSGGYAGDGWITPHYRVAYSWNEKSPSWGDVLHFLGRGGSVAVVTDRYYTSKTRQQVKQWAPQSFLDGMVRDADHSDEWMFESGVIGDLAYKPRTTALRKAGQDTGFVVKVYGQDGKMATLEDVKVEVQSAFTP